MIDMHSKYDNMHKNRMLYALICINNRIIACLNCMLSKVPKKVFNFFIIIQLNQIFDREVSNCAMYMFVIHLEERERASEI